MLLSVPFSIIAYNAIINAQRFLLQPEKHCNQVHANEGINATHKRMKVSMMRSFFKRSKFLVTPTGLKSRTT